MANIEQIKILCDGVKTWNDYWARSDAIPDLTHIEIRNANLQGAQLNDCDFDGSTFSNVDLRNSNLQHARLNGINVSRSSFENAQLQWVELKGSDFKRVCFRNAKLNDAEAFELKIRHSDLQNCNLDNSHLRFVHIYNSDLHGATFDNVEIEIAVLKRIFTEESQLALLRNAGFAVELANQPTPEEWLDLSNFSVRTAEDEFGIIVYKGKTYWINEGRWDFFISHASSVKETVVRPLINALRERGQRIWFDDFQIKAGDDLGKFIAQGVKGSLFGVVVISEDFFGRHWTEAELDSLLQKRIFLVLHGIKAEELKHLRPGLENRFCIDSKMGAKAVADKLIETIRRPPREVSSDGLG